MIYIYAHRNKINNKSYIGQTISTENRWKYNGYKYRKCPKFYNAIQKYGWHNFEHIILYEVNNDDDADRIEQLMIALFDTYNNGYNANLGGNGNRGHEIKNKENLGRYKHSKEQNKRIQKTMADLRGKIIRCIELNKDFSSIREAMRFLKKSDCKNIRRALKDSNYTAYGYHWQEVKNGKY